MLAECKLIASVKLLSASLWTLPASPLITLQMSFAPALVTSLLSFEHGLIPTINPALPTADHYPAHYALNVSPRHVALAHPAHSVTLRLACVRATRRRLLKSRSLRQTSRLKRSSSVLEGIY